MKVFDPVGSEPGDVCGRGAFVAMGNTRPEARAVVHGVEERGVAGTAFDPRTGTGHVARREGDYARARAAGVAVEVLLVETFGGLGDGLMNLLEEAQRVREDMLSASEYDETTWSARTWMVFVCSSASRWRRSAQSRTRLPPRWAWASPPTHGGTTGPEHMLGPRRARTTTE